MTVHAIPPQPGIPACSEACAAPVRIRWKMAWGVGSDMQLIDTTAGGKLHLLLPAAMAWHCLTSSCNTRDLPAQHRSRSHALADGCCSRRRLFVRSFIHSFIHPSIYPSIHSFIHSFIHSCIHHLFITCLLKFSGMYSCGSRDTNND